MKSHVKRRFKSNILNIPCISFGETEEKGKKYRLFVSDLTAFDMHAHVMRYNFYFLSIATENVVSITLKSGAASQRNARLKNIGNKFCPGCHVRWYVPVYRDISSQSFPLLPFHSFEPSLFLPWTHGKVALVTFSE